MTEIVRDRTGRDTGNRFYGWFDDPNQIEPTYEPPRDAPCPFCGFAIHGGDVRTHSLMYRHEYGRRSYFYRTHRTCAESDKRHSRMDGFILDMIAQMGE
jgi:hypothetical protein